MPSTGALYPAQSRAEAVQLIRESGKPMSRVSKDPGVSTESLHYWAREAEIDSGEREGLTTAEREELGCLRRKLRVRREDEECEIPKGCGLLCEGDQPDPIEAFRCVEHEKARHTVDTLYRVLGVCTSGYCAWRTRSPSRRARQDAELAEHIIPIHQR